MSYAKKTTTAKRDEIALVMRTASGTGEIPAGEVYFAGEDWRTGDLVICRYVVENDVPRIEVTAHSRFGGVKRHEPMVLLQSGGAGGFAAADAPGIFVGHGWQFVQSGDTAVLRKIPRGEW